MALWSNTDASASAPKYTVDVTSGNTGVQAFELSPIGTWGVDATEARAQNINGHAGWVLRTVGSGGRAGRTQEETLVAMGSISTDSEDTVYPDAVITILTQPAGLTVGAGNTATFTVVASATPSDATLTYQWYNAVTTQALSGNTAATLNIGDAQSTNTYYVIVSSTGATSVQSANAILTVA